MMYTVYALLNKDNYITQVESNDTICNIVDRSSVVEIDHGETEKYAFAQTMYFDEPLMNEVGCYVFQYIDGKIIRNPQSPVEEAEEEDGYELTNSEIIEIIADHEFRLCLMELGVTEDDL